MVLAAKICVRLFHLYFLQKDYSTCFPFVLFQLDSVSAYLLPCEFLANN
jgi:hypothetical protein